MSIKIVTKTSPEGRTGVAQYWHRLCDALGANGMKVDWVSLGAWGAGKVKADPAADILIVDNQDALAIAPEYAVIACQHGCAMEHGLRCRSEHVKMGKEQRHAAQRKRTFWVSCSDWAAYHCHRHMGVQADRIIFGCVDPDKFFPSERQRLRDAHVPIVMHHAADPNKGNGVIAKIAELLSGNFDVRQLSVPFDAVPDAMREADIWLGLSKSEGLPTVIQEAMATGMIVVGTDVGVLWPFASGTPVPCNRDGVAWLNAEVGALVFDWHWRDYPEAVADWVRAAWKLRTKFNPRPYAERWWNPGVFGQKWMEAIYAASEKLGVAGATVDMSASAADAGYTIPASGIPIRQDVQSRPRTPPRPYPQPQSGRDAPPARVMRP